MSVKENLEHIKNELNTHQPTIIAVTKYVTIERAKEAYEAGITHFGENRIEGLLEKKEALKDATFHFIGTLQSRKVKDVINVIDYLHSFDRMSLAKEIQKRARQPVKCFIQVNVASEASKHGFNIDEVEDVLASLQAYDKVQVIGLMMMAPHIDDELVLTRYFESLRALRDKLSKTYPNCTELSMGMSNDFALAAKCGATYVRIGTKLVG